MNMPLCFSSTPIRRKPNLHRLSAISFNSLRMFAQFGGHSRRTALGATPTSPKSRRCKMFDPLLGHHVVMPCRSVGKIVVDRPKDWRCVVARLDRCVRGFPFRHYPRGSGHFLPMNPDPSTNVLSHTHTGRYPYRYAHKSSLFGQVTKTKFPPAISWC